MDPTPQHIATILYEAAEITSPPQREAYLEQACGADLQLRQRVEKLLEDHQQAGDFLERPAALAADPHPPLTEAPGTVIGPYTLMELIGEGGMGLVFVARQERPVRRKVALKVIRPGMDTRDVIARFEAERQALAMMDHPHIARVLDAGATDAGRPFFVMELVKGLPITEYCDRSQLTPRERLALFVNVCQAVQHAHQKGVIHRDIKPSNVLVTLHDGRAVVKVIDFGIAKAIGQHLSERSIYTAFTQMIGTPLYMSPEQAAISGVDVDTRSDIYSLGVLLYELLTGTTPFSKERLKHATLDEVRRMIREEEPPRPSTRISTLGATASTIAGHRHSDPRRLAHIVRRELDWIVMKALEKDRNRRYDTANSLALDVQRYLADEPVEACPPSVWYRLRKFARRNKLVLTASAAVAAALLLGTSASTWQAVRATRAEAHALHSAQAERIARQDAEVGEAAAKAVLDFVQNKILAAARPEGQDGGLGREVTLGQAVEAALPFVEESFTRQPLVEGHLRETLGISFLCLGDADKARQQFERARAIRAGCLGPDHPDTLQSMHNLAISYFDLGRYDEALKLNEQILELRKAKLGPDHPETLSSMNGVAQNYLALGRQANALKLLEETLAIQQVRLGPAHHGTFATTVNLANAYAGLGRHAEAIELCEQCLALHRDTRGPAHPDTLLLMHNLANSYWRLGRYADALRLHEDALSLRQASLGFHHPDTLQSMNGVANSYWALGRYPDAIKLYEETLALRQTRLGLDHPDTLATMNNLANTYNDLGRHADALKLHEETFALRKAGLGSAHPDTLSSMHNLAIGYASLGRDADALKLFEETLALRKTRLGLDHPDTLATMNSLAGTCASLGRHADALKLFEETLSLQKTKLGSRHPDTLCSMGNLAKIYQILGRYDDALTLHADVLALCKASLGPDHPDVARIANDLAWLLTTCPDTKYRDPQRAVTLATSAVERAPREAIYWNTLGAAHYRAGDWLQAIEALHKSMQLSNGGSSFDFFFLAMAHWQHGQQDKARDYFHQAVESMDKNQPHDEELGRLRAEVHQMLQPAGQPHAQ